MSRQIYVAGLASAMDLPVERFAEPGATVVAGEDRRGERLVTHYRVGAHSVLWVDPDIEDQVSEWDGRHDAIAFDELRSWASGRGAELLGHGLEHLLPGRFEAPPRSAAIEVLDGTDAGVVEMVTALQHGCSDDDLEEADFDLEALDPHLVGWVEEGRLSALAGGRVFGGRPGCLDVGVLVHPAARRLGRGRAVIAAVVEEVLAAGHVPLYRCGDHNEGSMRLCRSLGFELVLEVEAYRWLAAA